MKARRGQQAGVGDLDEEDSVMPSISPLMALLVNSSGTTASASWISAWTAFEARAEAAPGVFQVLFAPGMVQTGAVPLPVAATPAP